jgi:hypothetical protein
MIADVMVHLTGSPADDGTRLNAVEVIASVFDSQIIGLFINQLPLLVPEEGGALDTIELMDRARETWNPVDG